MILTFGPMSMPRQNKLEFSLGTMLVLLLSTSAFLLSRHPWIHPLNLNPLIIGVLIGMAYSAILGHIQPRSWEPGITFCGKKILRLAIVLYGFRITFQQLFEVGPEGLTVSILMLLGTFFLGRWIGTRWLKLDRDTAILIASGSAVCGAAAVLATESVLRASPHKAVVAIATVVCFGTISMFLYPALYQAGVLDLLPNSYGIYVGGAVHEVAQVVVAGNTVPGAGEAAVIVKMTRVMLLVPLLFFLTIRYQPLNQDHDALAKPSIIKAIPWFAIFFVGVVGIHSLHLFSTSTVNTIVQVDTFLLTMAMTALGMKMKLSDFRLAGLKPFLLALLLFIWLLVGGYWITHTVVNIFAN